MAATLTRNAVQPTSAHAELGDEDMENLQTARILLTPPECALPHMCQAYMLVRKVRKSAEASAGGEDCGGESEPELVVETKAILRMIREFVVLHICCEHGSQDDMIFESALRACFENESVRGEVRSQMGLSRTAIRTLGDVNDPLSDFKTQVQKSKIWGSTLSDADVQALFELYGIAALGSKVGEPTEDAKQAKKARPEKNKQHLRCLLAAATTTLDRTGHGASTATIGTGPATIGIVSGPGDGVVAESFDKLFSLHRTGVLFAILTCQRTGGVFFATRWHPCGRGLYMYVIWLEHRLVRDWSFLDLSCALVG